MEIGDYVAALVPDEPRPGPLRHLEHVQREGILPIATRIRISTREKKKRQAEEDERGGFLPHGEVGNVDDGGRVLLEEAHGGELVGLQLPRRGDDERGGGAGVAEDQRGRGEGDDEGARGGRQDPAGLVGEQVAEPPRPRPRRSRSRRRREGEGAGGGGPRRRRPGGGAREVFDGMVARGGRRGRGEEAGGGRGGGGGHWRKGGISGGGGAAAAASRRTG